MRQLQEVFDRIQQIKKEQKEIKVMLRDALDSVLEHKELGDEIKTLRQRRKQLEDDVKADFAAELQKLDDLKIDLETEKELLNDIALTQYAQGEEVEVKDDYDNSYDPLFTVRFKKR